MLLLLENQVKLTEKSEFELKKKEVKIMLLEKELSDAIEIVSKVAKHS